MSRTLIALSLFALGTIAQASPASQSLYACYVSSGSTLALEHAETLIASELPAAAFDLFMDGIQSAPCQQDGICPSAFTVSGCGKKYFRVSRPSSTGEESFETYYAADGKLVTACISTDAKTCEFEEAQAGQ